MTIEQELKKLRLESQETKQELGSMGKKILIGFLFLKTLEDIFKIR